MVRVLKAWQVVTLLPYYLYIPGLRQPLNEGTSNINKMKAMANRGTDKKMGKWLDNNDVIRSLDISLRTFLLRQAAKPSGRRSVTTGRLPTLRLSVRFITSRRTLRRLFIWWMTGRRMPIGVSATRRKDRASSENRDNQVCNH